MLEQEILTVAQAAEALGCSTKTVRRMIARGDVPAYRSGKLLRIKASELLANWKCVTNAQELRGDM